MALASLTLLPFLLAAAPRVAAAAPAPWEGTPFAGDPRAIAAAATALPRPDGRDVDVLLEDTVLAFDAQGRATRTLRVVWRALSREAAQRAAKVEARWSPWHQERPELRARVVDAAGDVRELDPATLSEAPQEDDDGSLYGDDRVLRAPLPGMDAGAIVEQLTVLRDREPLFTAGTTTRLFVSGPARRIRLRVEAPASLPLRHAVRAPAFPPPAERVEAGRRVLTWDVSPVPAPPPYAPFAPPEEAAAPHVAIGTGASWGAVGAAYAALADRQLAGSDVRELARRVAGTARTREEAAARVLGFVAERLRYTGLELGASSLVPAAPQEVLRRSYGDCKDLSLLVVAMLRALGHDAYLALLRTHWDELSPELPGLGEVDHAIVYVPGRPALWLDPTSRRTSVGRLPALDQARLALIADGRARKLERTPEAASAENRTASVFELRMSEEGPAGAVATRELAGGPAERARALRRGRPAAELREEDERDAKQWLVAEAIVSARWDGIDDASAGVRSRVEVSGSRMAVTSGATATAVLGMKSLFEELPLPLRQAPKDGAPARKVALVLPEAFRAEITYVVTPPPAYRVKSLPRGEVIRAGPAVYESRFAVSPSGAVEGRYRFEVASRRLGPAESDALRDKVVALIALEAPRVELERTSDALLAEGRGRDAIAELRRMVALHPREARHRADLAYALVGLGAVEAARREAREAVALEPGSAWAHRALAWALEHDAIGRQASPQADLAQAVAEMRRARDLEPRAGPTRVHLGWLLTHAPGGEQYGEGAPLDEAIAELRFARKELERRDVDELLVEALLRAGRPAEALPVAREAKPSSFRNGALLAALALAEGPGPAVTEALKLDATDRTAALEAASLQLMGARRYPEAAALLDGGAAGSSGAAKLRARAAVLRRVRRWETLSLDERSASDLVRRVFAAMASPHPEARLAALASSAQRADLERELAGTPLASLLAGLSASLPKPLALPSVVDLVLSAGEVSVEGDDALRRVRATLFGPKDAFTLYALEERDGWKVAGVEERPLLAVFGAELARLARAGRLEPARRVLSWARADCPRIDAGTAALLDAVAPPARDPASREELLRAAAVLAAISPSTANADGLLRSLEEARAGADPAARRALELRVAQTQLAAGRWSAALATARACRAGDAAWLPAARTELAALWAGERWDELRAVAEARLAGAPGDALALQTLERLATRSGDFVTAERWMRAAIANGLEEHNELAWIELYRDPVPREALDHAQRGARRGDHSRAAAHTLSCVHAALGEPAEALQVLREAARARGEIQEADWLVVGRVAQSYGLLDDAAAAYRRIARPKDPHPLSAWNLAQRWLEGLERARGAGGGGR